MLPVNPDATNRYQAQLQEKITELNNLESWGTLDVALVSDSEIQSILNESLESLNSSPNESLTLSLLKLADRVKSEGYVGFEVKKLATQVKGALSPSIFPLNKDSSLDVLGKMKMKDLSSLSSVSHYGNKIGKEAIIARIKKVGFTGESYEEAIKYLKGFEGDFITQQRNFSVDQQRKFPSLQRQFPSLVKIFTEFSHGDKSKVEEIKIERIINVLEGLKDLSSTEILFFFISDNFLVCDDLRKFLFSNLDKVSLEDNAFAKALQAHALFLTADSSDIEGLKFLLGLGVSPDLKFRGVTILEQAKGWRNNPEVLELLTKAQRKPE